MEQKIRHIRAEYDMLKQEKRVREEDIQRTQRRVDEIKNDLSKLKWLVDPNVSISKISSSSQKDRYIGKFPRAGNQPGKPLSHRGTRYG